MAKPLNIFDFDHTIYDGDCTLDFYFFCLIRQPSILKVWPKQFWAAFLFLLGIKTRDEFKSTFLIFVSVLKNPMLRVKQFWQHNSRKIKPWYKKVASSEDVIISASPNLILEPIAKELGVKALISTKIDEKGRIVGHNCRGQEKVTRFYQVFGNHAVGRAYSDSKSDMPMLNLADHAFIVRGNTTTMIEL